MQEKTQQVDRSDAYIADKVTILDRRTLHDMLRQYVDDIFGYAGGWIRQLLSYSGLLAISLCVPWRAQTPRRWCSGNTPSATQSRRMLAKISATTPVPYQGDERM